MGPVFNKKFPIRQLRFALPIFAAICAVLYLTLIRQYLKASMSTVVIELILAASVSISLTLALSAVLVILIIILSIAVFKPSGTRTAPWLLRLKKTSIISGILVLLLAVITAGSQRLCYTPPILDEDGRTLTNSIASLEKVELGGSKQWITIRGKSKDKPILLFLAGGPGGSQLAATRAQLKGLENYFVVVNWDQPGSGKSYNSVSREALTPDRYVSDAYELSKYLCKRFNQEKIYVLGESWGSALGIMLVQKHPELYHAFMGTGQMISFLDTEIYDYNFAIKIAEEKGDIQTVNKLKQQGAPPYFGKDVTRKSVNYLMYLGNYMSENPSISNSGYGTFGGLSGPEYGLYDKVNYLRGMANTFNQICPQLNGIDLRKQFNKIDVPVYFLLGRHDISTPTSFAEEYYKILQAPHKELIWFEHSGHEPWRNERDKFVDTVVKAANM